MKCAIVVAASWLALSSSLAGAQVDPQPRRVLRYQNLFAVRINPLGLVDFAESTYRIRLYESDSDALKQNFVGFGAVAAISPAWGRIGLRAELQPLTILQLYAQYELIGYFGSFDQLATFPSASADYSDSTIDARGDLSGSESYPGIGAFTTLGATLQLKVGPIALRNLFRAFHVDFRTRRGDPIVYDPILDIAMPDGGWTFTNDVDLLAVLNTPREGQLAAGLRWTHTSARYRDTDYAAGEDPELAPSNVIDRVGPLVAWTLRQRHSERFDKPTLILLAQWHLRHRFRTGQDVTCALPYLGLAFRFQGDLAVTP